jgi:regulation of enolase protein 1 (concanavalin A-like superfamily)
MIYLSTSTQELNVQTSANSNVAYVVCWADVAVTGLSPNVAMGVIANTNVATIVPATQSFTVDFQITYFSLVNRDAANTQNVQVSINNGAVQANLYNVVLPPGWAAQYVDGQGLQILDASGLIFSQQNVFITGDATGNGTNNIAITLANTGVNAGSYLFTNLTVDSKGRLTAASNGANATTSVRGVTLLVDSITSQDTSNAATANAVFWALNAADANASIAANTANGAFLKANAGYVLANQAFVIGTQAFINANLASIQANAAANTVAVFANGTIVLADANLNFNNTSTVNVSASANGTTQSNVAFTVNSAAVLSGVVSGNTSNISITQNANGSVVIDTRLTPTSNGGTSAYEVDVYANGTLVLANTNLNFNNTGTVNVSVTANGITQANISFSANATALGVPAAFLKANAAYVLANQGFVVGTQALINANLASSTANAAYAQANAAANTVATFANGTLVLADANLNFNNTATVNVAASANGTIQSNLSFSVNSAAVLSGVVSGNTSNISITQNANGFVVIDTRLTATGSGSYQVDVLANGTLVIANANLNFNNTATVNVGITANGTTQANAAFNVNTAQVAINTAPVVNPLWYSYCGV